MVAKKSQKRTFNGMSYHEVQRVNSDQRKKLRKEDQKWLKENNFKNVSWDHVVLLYSKIEDFLEQYRLEDSTLEDLFLEADRLGNKYLTSEEIQDFNQQLAKEIGEIEAEIERQFLDAEMEVIDFGRKEIRNSRRQVRRSKR
jgi:hypothetical protein